MANYIHVPDEAPAVPKIDVTVDESDYRSGALKLIKELRPSWKPSEVKLKVFNLILNILPLGMTCLYILHILYIPIFVVKVLKTDVSRQLVLMWKKLQIANWY